MANDGNGDNNIEPLLQYLLNTPPTLLSLPENNDVTVPMPMMTPTEFKNRLIFGPFPPSQRDSSLLSQNPSPSFSDSSTLDLLLPPPEPNLPGISDLTHPSDQKTEKSDSKSIVRRAVALLVLYLSLGMLMYCLNRDQYVVKETHPVVDPLYFCIVTMCTIGYGDIRPNSVATKLFSIFLCLLGLVLCIYFLVEWLLMFLIIKKAMLETARDDPEKVRSSYIIDVKKGRMRIRMKVGLALGVVVLCIGFGVLIMHFVERNGWLDSFYFSVMSVTTVGYRGGAFKTMPGRLLASVWLLVSTLAVAHAFLYLAEARVDKRNRERAKRVLDENMSISEFFAADH